VYHLSRQLYEARRTAGVLESPHVLRDACRVAASLGEFQRVLSLATHRNASRRAAQRTWRRRLSVCGSCLLDLPLMLDDVSSCIVFVSRVRLHNAL